MRFAVFVGTAGLALTGSPTAAKEPRSVDLTSKSASDLAGCIALSLAETPGYELRKRSDGSTIELKMKFKVAGFAATAATFVIDDLGHQRRLTVFATGKESGAPRIAATRARQCAKDPSS